jgi:hypothetical protein
MALNATTYSGKQFAVYLAAETTTGTFNTTDANYRRVDVEGITLPTFNPQQEFEMRTGSGRIAEFDQIFSSTKRVTTEFTLSGRLTQEMWVILCESATGDEFDGGTGTDSVLTLDKSYAGLNFKVGNDPDAATDYSYLLSVYFAAPTAADSYSLKSCTCTNFSIDADMDSAAGRFNYSATFQTQSAPAKGEQSGLIAASTAIGSNFLYLSNWDERVVDVKGTASADDIIPLFKTFNFAIDCPTQFLGATGTAGEPEVWAKALPELSITYGGSVKYDNETDQMIEAFRDAAEDSYLGLYLADVPVDGTPETPTNEFFNTASGGSTSKFGIWAAKAKLTSCEVSSDDVAMVNFEAKVLAPTSGNALHLLGGDNV